MNIKYPVSIVLAAVVLGFIFNAVTGYSWAENVADMSQPEKIITYVAIFVFLMIWKNKDYFKKS